MNNDTIFALSSGHGKSGVAVIRISGEKLSDIFGYENSSIADTEAATMSAITGIGYVSTLPSEELDSDYMPDIPIKINSLDVLTTFADVDSLDMSDRNTTTTTDDLAKVERTVFNSFGFSQNMFNTNGNLSLQKSI